jgi:hypothetical protein
MRNEHRLKLYEYMLLKRIFAPEKSEVIGGWRKLHNVKLPNLYSSRNIIRMIKLRMDRA